MEIHIGLEGTHDSQFRHNEVDSLDKSARAFFHSKDYGSVKCIYLMVISVEDIFLNFCKNGFYKRRKPSPHLEIRLQTNHSTFIRASEIEAYNMIYAVILSAIENMKEQKIKGFDFSAFESDLKIWYSIFMNTVTNTLPPREPQGGNIGGH